MKNFHGTNGNNRDEIVLVKTKWNEYDDLLYYRKFLKFNIIVRKVFLWNMEIEIMANGRWKGSGQGVNIQLPKCRRQLQLPEDIVDFLYSLPPPAKLMIRRQ